MNPYPVRFKPIPQTRIWGGSKLKNLFGFAEVRAPIGEYWVLSGHPTSTSIVENGELAGKSLNEIIELYPDAYLGHSPQPRFPLLIKFLEATTDLSVQIHPDDSYAQKNEGDYGKTEAWFVLECQEKGVVNYGHEFSDKDEYFTAIKQKKVEEHLCYSPIQKETVVFVPSRTLHALLSGTVVIEIQQTSDITYRVYDWNRLDEQGNPRELHIDKAADVMLYNGDCSMEANGFTPYVLEKTDTFTHEKLLQCNYFSIEKLHIKKHVQRNLETIGANPEILISFEGTGKLCWQGGQMELTPGSTVLIPSTLGNYKIHSYDGIKLLRTYY